MQLNFSPFYYNSQGELKSLTPRRRMLGIDAGKFSVSRNIILLITSDDEQKPQTGLEMKINAHEDKAIQMCNYVERNKKGNTGAASAHMF